MKTYEELKAENERLEREAQKVLDECDFGRKPMPKIKWVLALAKWSFFKKEAIIKAENLLTKPSDPR
jgi:hypothetical protein